MALYHHHPYEYFKYCPLHHIRSCNWYACCLSITLTFAVSYTCKMHFFGVIQSKVSLSCTFNTQSNFFFHLLFIYFFYLFLHTHTRQTENISSRYKFKIVILISLREPIFRTRHEAILRCVKKETNDVQGYD